MKPSIFLISVIVALLLICSPVFSLEYGLSIKSLSVVNQFGQARTDVNSIAIYVPDSNTLATLYKDKNKAVSITNPILRSSGNIMSGSCQFWSDYVSFDAVVTTDGGGVAARDSITGTSRIALPQETVTNCKANIAGVPTAMLCKTKAFTFGHPGETTTDYAFTSAANTTEQSFELNEVIPALGRVIDVVFICTEDPNSSGGDGVFTVDVGATTGTDAYMTAADFNDLDNVSSSPADGLGGVVVSATASDIFVNATPGQNWSTYDAGEWLLIVTYIDNAILKEN